MRRICVIVAALAIAVTAPLGTAVSQAAPDPGIAPRAGIPKGAWVGTSTNIARTTGVSSVRASRLGFPRITCL